ncbi:MAG: PIN domain-containing protein [Gemmataceae bacterium]|nr:PIN domain-containing protein [Gemmataceae bacterium]MCI0741843.1 PIN domain-containing protein [Gemmataceae bacterium]
MIFVDTWAWVALADRRDAYHKKAAAAHQQLRSQQRVYVTSDFVAGETITYLYGALPAAAAESFVEAVLSAVNKGTYRLVHLSPQQFDSAWQLRKKYRDKPDISFVDLTSMVVMRELGISDVFTGDDHFRHVGMGFQLVP